MKKLFIFAMILISSALSSQVSHAQTAPWRWNFSADCSSLSDKRAQDMCFETTTASIYVCSPNSGEDGVCTSISEWKLAGGLWIDNGSSVYLKTARNVLIGTGLIQGNSSTGLGFDVNGDNIQDVVILPTGLISTPMGVEYVGSDAYLNINRTTDPSSTAIGNMWFNTTSLRFRYFNGALVKEIPTSLVYSNTFGSVTSSTSKILFKMPYGVRIESVTCIVDPADSGDVVPVTIQQCNTTADSCTGIDTAISCSNTGAADDGSINFPNITLGNWVAMSVGTVTGTASNVTINIRYTINVP